MQKGRVERRRGRRVDLEAPLVIRRVAAGSAGSANQELTSNISLAGVYFETEQSDAYTVNETLISSVSVPESKRRDFPFTRVAGRSRVVRIKELPQEEGAGRKRMGIALEFGEDVTALTAIPTRG